MVVTTEVPMAPASCCKVLMTALPSAFRRAGSCLSPLVMVVPTEKPWLSVKKM